MAYKHQHKYIVSKCGVAPTRPASDIVLKVVLLLVVWGPPHFINKYNLK